MKKTFFISALIFAFFAAKAQDGPKPPSMEEHLKRSQEMLQKELQMNDEQQKKVEQAFKDFLIEAEKLHKQYPPPPPPPMDPKMKEALDKITQERDAKVKMALTEEQYKKYLEAEKKMHPPHPPMGDKHPSMHPSNT